MRALVQRVDWAEVEVDGCVVGRIEQGLLVYLGVAVADTVADARRLAEKVAHLRVFEDADDKLNLSCRDARGGVLAVSNFTLLADTRKGRRPAFVGAAPAEEAERLYEAFAEALEAQGCQVARGVFGARMAVRSSAAGPVNVLIDVPPTGN
ncbi:MAG: D-aminoacyl-tRNA deacylase [Phycisphaerae bacterium]